MFPFLYKMFPFLYKMFPFFTKCFQVISDLGTRFSAMDQMCLTSMQLTQYNLDFGPVPTNFSRKSGFN